MSQILAEASATDIIRHFAGYLRLFDEPVLNVVRYSEGIQDQTSASPNLPIIPNFRPPTAELDDLAPAPIRMAPPSASPTPSSYRWESSPTHVSAPTSVAAGPILANDNGPIPSPPAATRVEVIRVPPEVEVTYTDDGVDASLFEARQVNTLADDDAFGFGMSEWARLFGDADPATDMAVLETVAFAMMPELFPAEPATALQLAAAATSLLPTEGHQPARLTPTSAPLPPAMGANDPGVPAVIARVSIGDLAEARFVDGAPVLALPTDLPAPDRPKLKDTDAAGPEHSNQTAVLGGNDAINIANIQDFGTFTYGSIMIAGDSKELNAIIQSNILRDDDEIRSNAGPVAATPSNPDDHQNIAEFVTVMVPQSQGQPLLPFFPSLDWDVHRVKGDLYDINMVQQVNHISDNDAIFQVAGEIGSQVVLGDNSQMNITNLAQSNIQDFYDLLVVGGSYHEFNVIEQKNIILDTDRVWTISNEPSNAEIANPESGSEGIVTGGNLQTNLASIINIGGGTVFETENAEARRVAERLADGEETQSLAAATAVPDTTGGRLTVLFVEGHVFDINYIRQVNLISDADVAVQVTAGGRAGLSVAAGANLQINVASIFDIDSNTAVRMIGGNRYAESMLVQAELLADEDTIFNADTQTLVNELVAFLDPTAMPADDDSGLGTLSPLNDGDFLGGVLT